MDYEIIVVNDASTDDTERITRDFLEKTNCRFQVINHEQNYGVSEARNAGIRAAKGKYIWFFDADDLADENFLTVLCDKAVKTDADIILCGYNVHNERDHTDKKRYIKLRRELPSARDYFPAFLLSKIPCNIWSCIIKKKCIDDKNLAFRVGLHYGEDHEFFMKLLVASERTCFVNKLLYTYVIHESKTGEYKPVRLGYDALRESTSSTWRIVKYVLRHSTNKRELTYALHYYLPWSIVREFKLIARSYGKERYEEKLRKLKHKKVRELLLSTAKMFFRVPELTFKAYMLLYFPKFYYWAKK